MRMKVPTCVITPGAVIEAETCATPPITALLPRIGISRSAASTPFCSGITPVSGPISGFIRSPALSTSHSLTQNSTISTWPTSAGSSVARVGTRWVSPRPPPTFSPWLFMAARWAPRATKVTSAPALASAAPNPPPTPPAPTTAIRMDTLPRSWLAKSGRLAEQALPEGKHIRPEQFGVSSPAADFRAFSSIAGFQRIDHQIAIVEIRIGRRRGSDG